MVVNYQRKYVSSNSEGCDEWNAATILPISQLSEEIDPDDATGIDDDRQLLS
jgi:hypothetical protein